MDGHTGRMNQKSMKELLYFNYLIHIQKNPTNGANRAIWDKTAFTAQAIPRFNLPTAVTLYKRKFYLYRVQRYKDKIVLLFLFPGFILVPVQTGS